MTERRRRAVVLSLRGCHVGLVPNFGAAVCAVMCAPFESFEVHLVVVEDGSEGGLTLPYHTAVGMAEEMNALRNTRRLRCASSDEAGARLLLALEAGRALAQAGQGDRVILVAEDASLQREFGRVLHMLVPSAAEEVAAFWRRREVQLVADPAGQQLVSALLPPPSSALDPFAFGPPTPVAWAGAPAADGVQRLLDSHQRAARPAEPEGSEALPPQPTPLAPASEPEAVQPLLDMAPLSAVEVPLTVLHCTDGPGLPGTPAEEPPDATPSLANESPQTSSPECTSPSA